MGFLDLRDRLASRAYALTRNFGWPSATFSEKLVSNLSSCSTWQLKN
jgi:hypothetical protein